MAEPQWEDVVLDTSAFIQGEVETLRRLGKRLWTVPEVIREAKDRTAKESANFALDILPEGLKQVHPSKESLDFVIEFAKKTGDSQALSKTDLLVLALTHELRQKSEGAKQTSSSTFLDGVKEAVLADDDQEEDDQEEAAPRKQNASAPSVTGRKVEQGKSWASVIGKGSASSSLSASPAEVVAVSKNREEEDEGEDDLDGDIDDEMLHELEMQQEAQGQVPVKHVMWDDDDFAVPTKSTTVASTPKIGSAAPLADSQEDFPVLTRTTKPTSSVGGVDQDKSVQELSKKWNEVAMVSNKAQPKPTQVESLEEGLRSLSANDEAKPSPPQKSTGTKIISSSNPGVTTNFEDQDPDLEWAKPGSASLGWSTVGKPKQLTKDSQQSTPNSGTPLAPLCSVACSTADFACQNVLLQLKLGVVSLDGRRITKVKSWVLKCDACYKIFAVPTDGKRLFCSHCGHPTLARLAFSTDADGNRRYHYAKSRRIKTQGNVFSIPKGADILLREDQLLSGIWAQRAARKSNTASMFGEDVNSAMGVGLKGSSAASIKVAFGSTNPNAKKGRERRGAAKKKKN